MQSRDSRVTIDVHHKKLVRIHVPKYYNMRGRFCSNRFGPKKWTKKNRCVKSHRSHTLTHELCRESLVRSHIEKNGREADNLGKYIVLLANHTDQITFDTSKKLYSRARPAYLGDWFHLFNFVWFDHIWYSYLIRCCFIWTCFVMFRTIFFVILLCVKLCMPLTRTQDGSVPGCQSLARRKI